MARNPSALIWITHKASEVQKKHKNMKWKTAIKEAAAAQYQKKDGVKKMAKKNLVKKEVCINILPPNFRFISYHGKQCTICSYETSILDFGTYQEMAQSS